MGGPREPVLGWETTTPDPTMHPSWPLARVKPAGKATKPVVIRSVPTCAEGRPGLPRAGVALCVPHFNYVHYHSAPQTCQKKSLHLKYYHLEYHCHRHISHSLSLVAHWLTTWWWGPTCSGQMYSHQPTSHPPGCTGPDLQTGQHQVSCTASTGGQVDRGQVYSQPAFRCTDRQATTGTYPACTFKPVSFSTS